MSELRKSLVIGGERYNLAVGQAGEGPPGENTPGKVGVTYLDTSAEVPVLYVCTAAVKSGEQIKCTWVQVGGAGSGSGENPTVEPADDDIPKVFITGVKPTTKDDVLAEMEYVSKTDRFHAYLEIKCQGSSSMSYPKKNYTVKLYSDESRETKLKKDFKDWNHPGNKFVLKANWIDHSHARNIVLARLWGEVVRSRPDFDSLPEEMRNAPNNGAVDGFPVKVYYNGTYEGLYTWNIGKDDWMWGMDEDNANHILLCNEGNNFGGAYPNVPSCFRALWDGTDGREWSIEVGRNSPILKSSVNNLIQFVMDNDGVSFRAGIGQYLDIQSAIDYYVFVYDICGLDSLGKNLLLATYDSVKWVCGAYDLDSTLGLFWNGSKFVSAQYACPEDYQEKNSLLWERIEANYADELKARQTELRKTVLSYSNIVTHFERFMDTIGKDLYAEDLTVYSDIPSADGNNIQQIRNFVRDRQTYVDAEFAAMTGGGGDTDKTLTSISATYSGGDVEVGTPVTALTGVVVTAHYSDGSTSPVFGYILSGTIAEGINTVTVSYDGMTATFTVNGVSAEEKSITLDKTAVEVTDEYFVVLTAITVPASDASNVVWASDNKDVATVEDGIVRILANGTAKITATVSGNSASCDITVTEPEISYTWSETAEHGIDDAGNVVSGDQYITDMFTAPPGNYTVHNNNDDSVNKVYGKMIMYTEDNTVHKTTPAYALDEGAKSAVGTLVDEFSNKLRFSAWVPANGTIGNVTLMRNRGLWSEFKNILGFGFAIDGETGEIETGNDCVSAVKVPVIGGKTYSLANKDGGTFKWKGVAEYKADSAFIRFTQDSGVVDPLNVVLHGETAFVRLVAAQGTDPNTYLEFTRMA